MDRRPIKIKHGSRSYSWDIGTQGTSVIIAISEAGVVTKLSISPDHAETIADRLKIEAYHARNLGAFVHRNDG